MWGHSVCAYNYYINYPNGDWDTVEVQTATLTNAKTGKVINTKKINEYIYWLFIPVQKLDPYTTYKVVYTYNIPNEMDSRGMQKQYTISFTTGKDTTDSDYIEETSPSSFTYNGKTYDMNKYINDASKAQVNPNLIKTKDNTKLLSYLKEAKTQFNDFKEKEYWANAVVWMYANEIMAGSPTTKKISGTNTYYKEFMPNSNLTEVQMLAMMFRYTDNEAISKFPSNPKDYGECITTWQNN